MIDRKALLADLKKQVGTLEGNLRERAADDADTHARLHGEWQKAREASRIAATYETWLDDRVTQAAVAWVLGTVFLRFCEDNGLIEMPFLAGPGDKLDLAQERQADYIRQNPHDTDRDWILAGFKEMSRSSVAAGLFDRAHNPMWQIEIPHPTAKALLAFWRRRGEDGEIVHDFTDPDWDTRFLGDLYQDLSEHAKKTYALLQTPDFVEEFILDYTLEPAVDEFGLDGLRLIDPTCGSGHFLLGAFHRILNKWRTAEPATDIWELIRRTLLSVHGVDKNPFATNIARFRMLAAAMKAGGVTTLTRVPDFPIIVATGDSLLHGRGASGIQEDLFSSAETHTYITEDIYDYVSSEDEAREGAIDLLGAGSYHVVVGNPPYISVDDPQESGNYRRAYQACSGRYSLAVPFMERFVQLAKLGSERSAEAGYVGKITANSFMKRIFGKKLIEEFLPKIDLTHVIDASGADIPGNSTPSVIFFMRRRWPKSTAKIRSVLGLRGMQRSEDDPPGGPVWQAITAQLEEVGSESEWVSVVDLGREFFAKHPWTLSGGGANLVLEMIESGTRRLEDHLARRTGFGSFPGQDAVFFLGEAWAKRNACEFPMARPLISGAVVRDWSILPRDVALVPYGNDQNPVRYAPSSAWGRHLWTMRRILQSTVGFDGREQQLSSEDQWWTWYRWIPERYETPLSLTYAEIASHNHFAFDRGGRVYNQTAPVIKLKSADDVSVHTAILAILNSSVACFWLKQVCQTKANATASSGIADQPWSWNFQFSATKVDRFPLPEQLPVELGIKMDALAREFEHSSASRISEEDVPTRANLQELHDRNRKVRERAIALQEELDWKVYCQFNILDDEVTCALESVPNVKFGERAFEIVLARKLQESEVETKWFERHDATPIVEIPGHWPEDYKKIVERRIEIIEARKDIALIERPEYKRRWAGTAWNEQEKIALRSWLLNRCEERSLWIADDEYGTEQPRVMTVSQLADQLRRDEDFVSIARLYAGDDLDLSKVIAEITRDEHVPHLTALRYKDPSGLRKRAQWEGVWEQQREEDRTGKRLDIPVPPKYTSADFLKSSYWRNRGKLDVPKERFISYPKSGPDGDSSILLGWAGWDHREQAQALMMLIEERATQDGWDVARLTPLLAGLAEVLPWVRQWHGEVDPAFGQSPADAYTMYLESKQREYGISDGDLKNWRP
ncbi:BREX-2 system adenine-specific DNA-methyltransferase PglX [Actinomadura opuntiae]|uniref:BREX-2 system adenine-specific DNA-methyltransferase PglX n=1 Tax=Actinomadura sp. OS1-43 TaxID=604315 RepID=UPI00255A82C1|nr:BREX-2 system adenine-specific DNA-methyltransferase PglX [Actinomadura sp. OS1-43]MDL4820778.1 BREX-2 system adenine-specific DNA-methyltransferase PglX [Actinomadura sp. OS1-43]